MPAPINAAASAPLLQLERKDAAPPSAEFAKQLERKIDSGPSLVRAQRTQLSERQAADALASAWTQVTGEVPNEKTVAMLTAQWSHETAGGRSMLNFNFGGIKGTGPSGLTAAYRTREGHGATERRIVDRFRAYESAEEGAVDYVKLLTGRYTEAVEAMREGDPAQFVRGLKQKGYFTGSEVQYTRSITAKVNQILGTGFDVSGAGALSSVPRMASASEFQPLASADWGPPGLPSALAGSIADELSRAAIRIAAGEREDREL